MITARELNNGLLHCPYCQFGIREIPERAGRCPQCGNKVYVHHQQTIFDSVLMTKAQAEVLARFIRLAKEMHYTEADYHERFEDLKQTLGVEPSPDEVLDALESMDQGSVADGNLTSVGDYVQGSDIDEIHPQKDEDKQELLEIYEKMVAEQEDDMLSAPSLLPLSEGSVTLARPLGAPSETKTKQREKFILASLVIFETLGVPMRELDHHHEKLKSKLGRNPHPPETIFSMFQSTTQFKYKDHHRASLSYLKLARLFHSYGFRCFSILRQSARERLLHLRDQGCSHIELSTEGTCAVSKKWNGTVMAINEAVIKLPLPDREMMSPAYERDKIGWCEFDYIPVGRS